MNLRLRERFGCRRVLSNYGGYAKIHQTMLANIFAVLNPSFWDYIISLQLARFRMFTDRMNQSYLKFIFVIFVGIFYLSSYPAITDKKSFGAPILTLSIIKSRW
jgi:hypothetical protein